MNNRAVNFILTLEGKQIDKFTLIKGELAKIIIGKDRAVSDIVINQSYISKKHLEIFKDEFDTVFITDLHSTNGIFVNNMKIIAGKKFKVEYGDVITFMDDSFIQLLVLNPEIQYESKHSQIGQNVSETIIQVIEKNSIITIGRSNACDIVLDTNFASKKHAVIERKKDGRFFITDNNSTNGTYVNNNLLTGTLQISVSDNIKIGRFAFKLSDYIGKVKELAAAPQNESQKLRDLLILKETVIIGRSKEADIQILDNLVSRKHARISRTVDKYYVEDLQSANGVFLNGKRIKKKTSFSENDEIRIGLKVFKLDESSSELSDFTAIRTENITKKYPNDYVGLKPMSFNIPARSFIALMGPSGCGKTTLMNMLNGANPATSGKVYIHGLELTSNFDLLKQKIAYVPQDDIVHKELTVNKSLFYAAKLRMNKDTTNKEIKQRINEVCKNLNINDKEIRENKIKDLSGGQRKRVSIAVELLNNPSILFLDEPTSPLDPETIDGFLSSIKELTVVENTTVIMVTHKPSDLQYVDRVIFLAKKGYPAYYGNENQLYSYFSLKEKDIIGVYSKLSKTTNLKSWYAKWQQTHKSEHVTENPSAIKNKRKESLLRQFFWLSARYANIKLNDKANMAILMLQPLIIPLALIYIFEKLQLSVLFLMAISAIWFGVSNAAKEIVKEMPIYSRERMFNLNIYTYLLSKIIILSVIAVIQIALFIFILKLKFTGDDIYLANTLQLMSFMFYLTFSATLLGLLLSVIFKNSEQVMSIIPIILIPQIIFAGVIADIDTKDKEVMSYVMLGRWGTEGLSHIQNDCADFSEYDNLDNTYKTKSVYAIAPAFNRGNNSLPTNNQEQENNKFIKANPITQLGFYKNNSLLNVFNSFNKNILAISILNVLIFIMIYILLKKKDKI